MPKALIIGVTSQDGSYMADLLLSKGYEVVGSIRRSTTFQSENVVHLYGKIKIEIIDLTDGAGIDSAIRHHQPDEVYNFASQSVPADSWPHPIHTGEVTALGPLRVLEAVRKYAPKAKVYQATSREIFGNIDAETANEFTPMDPNNPYGIAKAYAHMMVRCYREAYGMFVCAGILFNHESPRRSLHFVTRKVTAAVACVKNGVQNPPMNEIGELLVDRAGKVHLGNLDSMRDWGYSKDYMEAVWLMMQNTKPKDYVIGTTTSHSVRELCEVAFARAGLNWEDHVVSDDRLLRPTEIKELMGDHGFAKKELGWEPKTSFKELVELMVDADIERFTK